MRDMSVYEERDGLLAEVERYRSTLSDAQPLNSLEAQAIVRLMMHMSGDQVLYAATLQRDVRFLLARASASLGIDLDVQVSRVLDTLALAVPR